MRYPAFFAFYLDMVLVEALDNRVSEELIVRSNALPLLSRPLHVLLPPSKAVVTVHEAQYHLNPMLPCLRQHEIQPLETDEHRRKKETGTHQLTNEQTTQRKQEISRGRAVGTEGSEWQTSAAKDLEGVLVVAAGGILQGIAAAVAERPRPGHGEPGGGGLAQRGGDLAPLGGVGAEGHEPVGVEPVGEERVAVQHEVGALDPHEPVPPGLCSLTAAMDAEEQQQSKSSTKPPHSPMHSSFCGLSALLSLSNLYISPLGWPAIMVVR